MGKDFSFEKQKASGTGELGLIQTLLRECRQVSHRLGAGPERTSPPRPMMGYVREVIGCQWLTGKKTVFTSPDPSI